MGANHEIGRIKVGKGANHGITGNHGGDWVLTIKGCH